MVPQWRAQRDSWNPVEWRQTLSTHITQYVFTVRGDVYAERRDPFRLRRTVGVKASAHAGHPVLLSGLRPGRSEPRSASQFPGQSQGLLSRGANGSPI